VKDAAQGAAEDVPQDVAQDLAFGGRAARALLATAPPPPPSLQLALRWGRNWAAQWHLARALGKRFRGCREKRLYGYYLLPSPPPSNLKPTISAARPVEYSLIIGFSAS